MSRVEFGWGVPCLAQEGLSFVLQRFIWWSLPRLKRVEIRLHETSAAWNLGSVELWQQGTFAARNLPWNFSSVELKQQ